jgi:hypothetical protein
VTSKSALNQLPSTRQSGADPLAPFCIGEAGPDDATRVSASKAAYSAGRALDRDVDRAGGGPAGEPAWA